MKKRIILYIFLLSTFYASLPQEFLPFHFSVVYGKIKNYYMNLGILPGQELFAGGVTKYTQISSCLRLYKKTEDSRHVELKSLPRDCQKYPFYNSFSLFDRILIYSIAFKREMGVNNFNDDIRVLRALKATDGILKYYCDNSENTSAIYFLIDVNVVDPKSKKIVSNKEVVNGLDCENLTNIEELPRYEQIVN
ncbi:MAG: hypothetical protein H6625_05800 [Bdellovibrionaceae bacterium]|nr:hypothetical protein [Pseudobdellovibrionaceae bacterium]